VTPRVTAPADVTNPSDATAYGGGWSVCGLTCSSWSYARCDVSNVSETVTS